MKNGKQVLCVLALLLSGLWAPQRAWAAMGLRTQFGEVVVRNLKIGQTYSLHKMLNLPLRLLNTSETAMEIKVDQINLTSQEAKAGYDPVPEPSWITLEKRQFNVEPNHEAVTDITIQIPNDPTLLGRRFEADIWSRTITKAMYAVGIRSRLLIHVSSELPTDEELKNKFVNRQLANLDFTLFPTEGLAADVPVGREFDLKKERKLSIKLVNPNDDPLNFRIKSIGAWESLIGTPDGFENPMDPNWVKPAANIIQIPGNSIKETGLTVNIPDQDRFYGKPYFFVISVDVLEQEIPTRVYYKLLVKTVEKEADGSKK